MAVGAGAPSSVQVVEVEVDTWLARVRVVRAWTGYVGKLASAALARNQAAGAFIQGIGYALYEAREIDPGSGHVLSGNMDDYRNPGIGDMPPLEVHFEESGFDHVPGGASASAKSPPCRHLPRSPTRSATRSACARPRFPSGLNALARPEREGRP